MAKQFHLGCQTITFGNEQSDRFPEVFRGVAAAGYEGMEIGFRHLQRHQPAAIKALLDANHLVLAASHGGGNMLNPVSEHDKRSYIDMVADYLAPLGTKILNYSGLGYGNPEQFAKDIDVFHRTAQACLDRGIRLLYHNHDGELMDGERVIKAVLALESPKVDLCVDVGWVVKGGPDVLDFLERVKSRIGFIHYKDFRTGKTTPRVSDTVLLGEGVVPLAQIATWLKANAKDIWVVAEQDTANIPAEAAVAANAKYLQKVF